MNKLAIKQDENLWQNYKDKKFFKNEKIRSIDSKVLIFVTILEELQANEDRNK